MEVRGVLSSWEAFAKNSERICSERLTAVTSVISRTTPPDWSMLFSFATGVTEIRSTRLSAVTGRSKTDAFPSRSASCVASVIFGSRVRQSRSWFTRSPFAPKKDAALRFRIRMRPALSSTAMPSVMLLSR